MIAPDGWLTVEQVAEKLGVSKQTVYRYIRIDGLCAHLRRGHERGRLISADDLESWLRAQYGGADGTQD